MQILASQYTNYNAIPANFEFFDVYFVNQQLLNLTVLQYK